MILQKRESKILFENKNIQYAQKQLISGSKNGLKLSKIVHIAQISTDRIRILFRKVGESNCSIVDDMIFQRLIPIKNL